RRHRIDPRQDCSSTIGPPKGTVGSVGGTPYFPGSGVDGPITQPCFKPLGLMDWVPIQRPGFDHDLIDVPSQPIILVAIGLEVKRDLDRLARIRAQVEKWTHPYRAVVGEDTRYRLPRSTSDADLYLIGIAWPDAVPLPKSQARVRCSR